MLYTLVIVTALIPTFHPQSGGNVSTHSVSGFSTEQACINAGNKIVIPSDGNYHKTKAVFTCVKMDI
jgi:hypothetical protein